MSQRVKGKLTKGSLFNRIKSALQRDPEIACLISNLEAHPGFPERHFAKLGITDIDLRILERQGLSLRGYYDTGKGKETRWVLVGRD